MSGEFNALIPEKYIYIIEKVILNKCQINIRNVIKFRKLYSEMRLYGYNKQYKTNTAYYNFSRIFYGLYKSMYWILDLFTKFTKFDSQSGNYISVVNPNFNLGRSVSNRSGFHFCIFTY